MKRILFFIAALLICHVSAFAEFAEFEVDGIHYVLRSLTGKEGAWVTSTSGWAFHDGDENTYTGDITIPYQVTYNDVVYPVIGLHDKAFKSCTSIHSLTLSEGVEYIFPGAFNDTQIEEIYLPSTFKMFPGWFVNEINGYDIFQGCLGLERIVVAGENPVWDSRDNCNALIETATNTLWEGCDKTTIPSSVKAIGPEAFRGRQIQELTIPDGVETIFGDAFEGCSQLTSITFPESVKKYVDTLFSSGVQGSVQLPFPKMSK